MRKNKALVRNLKIYNMIGAQRTGMGETKTRESDIGEAGSPDGTRACKMDLSPLIHAIVHC